MHSYPCSNPILLNNKIRKNLTKGKRKKEEEEEEENIVTFCVIFAFAFLCGNVLHKPVRDLESIKFFILNPTKLLQIRIRNRFRWIIINAMIPHIPF